MKSSIQRLSTISRWIGCKICIPNTAGLEDHARQGIFHLEDDTWSFRVSHTSINFSFDWRPQRMEKCTLGDCVYDDYYKIQVVFSLLIKSLLSIEQIRKHSIMVNKLIKSIKWIIESCNPYKAKRLTWDYLNSTNRCQTSDHQKNVNICAQKRLLRWCTLQVSSGLSARTGWGVGGLISGFKDSMMLKKEGRFQGSLEYHNKKVLINEMERSISDGTYYFFCIIKNRHSLCPTCFNYGSHLRI